MPRGKKKNKISLEKKKSLEHLPKSYAFPVAPIKTPSAKIFEKVRNHGNPGQNKTRRTSYCVNNQLQSQNLRSTICAT